MLEIKNNGSINELQILSHIGEGGVTLEDVIASTKEIRGQNLRVQINSGGGSVFQGIGIYNYLKNEFPNLETEILGIGASIASVIFLAGKTRIMNKGSVLMIHNPYTRTEGDSKQLHKDADTLDKVADQILGIYLENTAYTKEELKALMDNETWMNEQEALESGFATEVLVSTISASIEYDLEILSQYTKVPESLIGLIKEKTQPVQEETIQVIETKNEVLEGSTNSITPIQGEIIMDEIVAIVPTDIQDAIKPTASGDLKFKEYFNAVGNASANTPKEIKEILDVVAEQNVVRQIAGFYNLVGDAVVPVPGLGTATWGAEGATITGADPTIATVSFGSFTLQGMFGVTDSLMEDSFYNVSKMIKDVVGGTLAEAEATAMLGTGAGADKPQGIFNKTADVTTAGSGVMTANEFIDFMESLETKYRTGDEVLLMNPVTFGKIAGLADTSKKIEIDRTARKINGVPYILSSLIATYAATNKIIAYGNFKRGYAIAQRGAGIKTKKVPTADAFADNLLYAERIDGRIVDSGAYKVLALKV